jgi:hypothetical protein
MRELKWRNRVISRIANFRLPATTLHLCRRAAAAQLTRLPPSLDAAAVIVSRVCGQQKQRWHAQGGAVGSDLTIIEIEIES